jgi:hypothetical protein
MVGKVSASTQNAKPRLSITLVDAVVESDRVLAKADISKITPIVTSSQVIPTAALAYTIPAADIAYIDLFLDIEIDNTGLFKYVGESVVLTDGRVMSFARTLSDTVSFPDSTAKDVSLSKSDSVSLSDTLSRLLIFIRLFNETVSLADALAIVTTFNRSFSENAAISDSRAFTFEKYLFDSFALNDLSDVNGTTISFADFTNNVISASDARFLANSKLFQDALSLTDSGNLRSQNYCDPTYFAEDYVGESRTF